MNNNNYKQQPGINRLVIIKMQDIITQKRMKFRQQIRRRQIEQMRRQRRKIILKDYHKQRIEQQQKQMYLHILTNSHRIFEQQQNYLQLLRQALNWGFCQQYNNLFADIVLNMIKYYQQFSHTQNRLILLTQCISLLYYHYNIPFDQINKAILIIVYEQLIKHMHSIHSRQSQLVINRCLIAIQNITYHLNQQILQLCVNKQILQKLQQLVQDFPFCDTDKDHILGIYQNIINYHIINQQLVHNQSPYYFPILLECCITQTQDQSILTKCVQILEILLRNKMCGISQIIQTTDALFVELLKYQFYIPRTQYLTAQITEFICNSYQDKANSDSILQLFVRIKDILDQLVGRYCDQVNPQQIAKIFQWITVQNNTILQVDTIINFVKNMCNFWVDCPPQKCTYKFDYHFLKFLNNCLANIQVTLHLFNQFRQKIQQDNAIKAPTWEIILQFLKNIQLQQPQKQAQYLYLLQKLLKFDMVTQYYKSTIIQKIQGIYNSHPSNGKIIEYAHAILEENQRRKL